MASFLNSLPLTKGIREVEQAAVTFFAACWRAFFLIRMERETKIVSAVFPEY
jgi:hypothetical protein